MQANFLVVWFFISIQFCKYKFFCLYQLIHYITYLKKLQILQMANVIMEHAGKFKIKMVLFLIIYIIKV